MADRTAAPEDVGPRVLSIGAVIENGVHFDPKNWRDGDMAADSLPSDVDALLAALDAADAGHVLVGGIAVLSYVSGRNTQDIDLILDPAVLDRLPSLVVEGRDRDFARCRFGHLQVDLLLTTNPFFAMVRDHHTTVRPFRERDLRCATVEGLVLLKLYALPSLYRQGDDDRRGLYEHDIVRLVETYEPDLGAIFRELEPYLLATDIAELRRLLDELLAQRRRADRFDTPEGTS